MNDVDSVTQAANEMYANTEIAQERPAALLLGGVAINLAVIAEAITKIIDKNPDPTKPANLRDLTDEEKRVVEALRKGDLALVPYRRQDDMEYVYAVEGTIKAR